MSGVLSSLSLPLSFVLSRCLSLSLCLSRVTVIRDGPLDDQPTDTGAVGVLLGLTPKRRREKEKPSCVSESGSKETQSMGPPVPPVEHHGLRGSPKCRWTLHKRQIPTHKKEVRHSRHPTAPLFCSFSTKGVERRLFYECPSVSCKPFMRLTKMKVTDLKRPKAFHSNSSFLHHNSDGREGHTTLSSLSIEMWVESQRKKPIVESFLIADPRSTSPKLPSTVSRSVLRNSQSDGPVPLS